jgi:hypothetical protein
MTKRTPLQEYRVALEKRNMALQAFGKAKEAAIGCALSDAEKVHRIETDGSLTPPQRLETLKSLQAWPRIVLGVYEAERARVARKARKDRHSEPSDIAYDAVGKVVGLSGERVKALCREGRQHLKEGMPPKPRVSVAAFKRYLRLGY